MRDPVHLKVFGICICKIKLQIKFGDGSLNSKLIYRKILAVTFSFGTVGLKTIFYRLFFLPIAVALLWIYYSAINVNRKKSDSLSKRN